VRVVILHRLVSLGLDHLARLLRVTEDLGARERLGLGSSPPLARALVVAESRNGERP
jgi:hypothetical protein